MYKIVIELPDGKTEKIYVEKEEEKDYIVASYLANPNNKVKAEKLEG
jgi:hypothetical protein